MANDDKSGSRSAGFGSLAAVNTYLKNKNIDKGAILGSLTGIVSFPVHPAVKLLLICVAAVATWVVIYFTVDSI